MTVTGPAELLAVWEAGQGRDDRARSLLLHRAARPEATDEELLSVPLGEREADLFALRRALFGERLQVRIDCGACTEAMEFDLDTDELRARPPQPASGPLRIEEDGWVVEFRLPTVADLEAVAATPAAAPASLDGSGREDGRAPDPARRLLLGRCTVSAERHGRPVPRDDLSDLPENLQRRLAEAVERADPAAEVTLKVACPECAEATLAELDITSYLWTELDSWARDQLLDVHLLASAYGWSEQQILALSPLRRRYYLELCADA